MQDWFRKAVILEPRGSDVLVGALITEPVTLSASLDFKSPPFHPFKTRAI